MQFGRPQNKQVTLSFRSHSLIPELGGGNIRWKIGPTELSLFLLLAHFSVKVPFWRFVSQVLDAVVLFLIT